MTQDDPEGELASALAPFATSPDLIAIVNRDQQIAARNPAAHAHAPNATDAASLVPQESRETLREAVQRALASGEPSRFEWGESGPGGVRSWYSTTVSSIEIRAQIAGAIISSHEVTELKRSEERLRRSEQLMVDTQGVAHLGTWEWDITQPTATWSAELYRIYGLSPETYTPSYEVYLTLVHPDDRQRVIEATDRVFHQRVPYSHDERIFRPDGSIRYLHTWAHPVVDQHGTLLKLVGVCQDITDRMEAQEAVRRLNSELEQRVSERTQQLETALRDLEAFNSMVSHDLRSPLAVIHLAVDMIEHGRDVPARIAPLLERIRGTVDNMAQLISNLLTFARAGHDALHPMAVDGSALCSELVAEYQHASTGRNVAVQIEPGLRLQVDPTLFRVALSNLIENAWKYSARSPAPRIEIGAVQRPDGRALFIRDNGIGFETKDHDLLFRPFTRLANASEFKGTGIGLATVERVIERHGGAIRAEGALGEGATFFLVLPQAAWTD